ncbi:hypothetical protein AL036_03275 [Salipiger aestuarii]|uniref:hypothetical protein n=1 Tax=Salipiger aestuarii TaxID=568098 RepID=UPI00025B658D|nr:hypothetical protein [Salipiger aestuarii]EIE49242.1 hypothetical protein C357_20555 [Citreicella sp. 357]KAA8609761.1 hypothetical protein AL036_03275 [Salipiger aestuarii]
MTPLDPIVLVDENLVQTLCFLAVAGFLIARAFGHFRGDGPDTGGDLGDPGGPCNGGDGGD